MDGLLSLLPEDQRQAIEGRARSQGLLNFGLALMQAAEGQPGQRRPSLLGAVGRAGPAGLAGYQSGIDQTLREILVNQQMQDAQRKRQQQEAQQAAMQRFVSTLPEDQRALAAAFPEQFATQRFREAPGVVGEFQAAKAAGEIPAGTTLPQYIEMKRPPGTTVKNIVGGEKDPFDIEAAKKQASVFSGIQESGLAAQRAAKDINKLGNILTKVDTGGVASFKQAAGNFGIKTEGLDDIQAAQAIINKLVPAQRPPGSGTMSDADLALYKESLPRLINQPGANREIVKSMKEINEYVIKEGQIASDVIDKKITPAEGRRKLLELGNPIQDFFERNQSASPTSPRTQLPKADEDLINRYLRR
jgi:hypothetical protein